MGSSEFDLFVRTQERLIDQQQKMADDIGEIKTMVREAIHTVGYVVKDLDDLKARMARNELVHVSCPARNRAQGWASVLKDLSLIIAILSSGIAVYVSLAK